MDFDFLNNNKDKSVERINKIDIQSKNQVEFLKIFNILVIIILIITVLNTVDSILVKKYKHTPIFALPLTTYKDGGSKAYYGVFYKVIKYKQVQGRRDIEMGSWALKYNTTPTDVTVLELAVEFRNDPVATYKKFKHKFLRIKGTVSEIDLKRNKLILKYTDTDGKYNFDIECSMADNKKVINYIEGNDVVVLGSVENFYVKTKTTNNTLKIENAFAE